MDKYNLTIVDEVPQVHNFSFKDNTTYRAGGVALKAYFPESISQTVAVYKYLEEKHINFVILGNGSNVLASDKPFNGAVISTKNLKGVWRTGEDSIFCLAGTKVSALLKFCEINGCGGLEYLAGIPATIGGLVYMNGGAGGKYIGADVIKVKFFNGKIQDFSNIQCDFGNKYSTMRDINCVILGAELKIAPQKDENVRQKIAERLKTRKRLPKGASCGCVFKNYNGVSAGKIIDEAGLKGFTLGGAMVSEEHANFIINSGTSSSDVKQLIDLVKRRVFEVKGITLEEEVVYIGDF